MTRGRLPQEVREGHPKEQVVVGPQGEGGGGALGEGGTRAPGLRRHQGRSRVGTPAISARLLAVSPGPWPPVPERTHTSAQWGWPAELPHQAGLRLALPNQALRSPAKSPLP